MKVWIAQLKCPNNHTVTAVAAKVPDEESGRLEWVLRNGFDHLVEQGTLNRECGICKSTTLHVEIGKTMFDSMEEARPALEESQRQQLATAEFLRRSKN
jgi:hypothetical protein